MSVKATHPLYDKFIDKWTRCRDVLCGQDAVHAAGVKYLPKLKEQEEGDYNAYVARAGFYNATFRTADGLRGMLFRQPPTLDVPAQVKPMLDDVTLDGKPLQVFLMEIVLDVLGLGRLGILVDYPPIDTERMTAADAQSLNARPYIAFYRAESIINWRKSRINNKTVLSMVVLKECRWVAKNEFEGKDEEVYRVLDLDPGSGNRYRVRVYRVDKDQDILIEGPYYPVMNGKPLDYIPFQILNGDDNDTDPDDPPMIDLVDVNLSHYRTTADYEHGCHFTGLPTPWIAGYRPEAKEDGSPQAKMYIGSTHAWLLPDPNAKAGYLEFTGQGLTALKENLDRKEGYMAVLGARMLEPLKKQVETVEVAALHRAGEISQLAALGQATSLGFKQVLVWLSRWAGATVPDGSDAVKFELNRDFFPVPMDYNLLNSLVSAWQKGGISHETLFWNLQKREVVPKDKTFEDEQTTIENEGPTLAAQPPTLGQPPVPPKPPVPPTK